MTRIKICGITNSDDAVLAVRLGANELGFNFYERSPRYLLPETAKSIIDDIPDHVTKVGVFVNESLEKIGDIVKAAGLNAVQLHGDEDNDLISDVKKMTGLPVIKALRISPDFELNDVVNCIADAVLLDSYSPEQRGGTGKTFDWQIAGRASIIKRLYLAGGLNPGNVAAAIRETKPFAIDVCSGVESAPGKKDGAKLEQFIRSAKQDL